MNRSSLCLNCAQIHDCPLDHDRPCVHDRRNAAPVSAETVESLLAERDRLRAELADLTKRAEKAERDCRVALQALERAGDVIEQAERENRVLTRMVEYLSNSTYCGASNCEISQNCGSKECHDRLREYAEAELSKEAK